MPVVITKVYRGLFLEQVGCIYEVALLCSLQQLFTFPLLSFIWPLAIVKGYPFPAHVRVAEPSMVARTTWRAIPERMVLICPPNAKNDISPKDLPVGIELLDVANLRYACADSASLQNRTSSLGGFYGKHAGYRLDPAGHCPDCGNELSSLAPCFPQTCVFTVVHLEEEFDADTRTQEPTHRLKVYSGDCRGDRVIDTGCYVSLNFRITRVDAVPRPSGLVVVSRIVECEPRLVKTQIEPDVGRNTTLASIDRTPPVRFETAACLILVLALGRTRGHVRHTPGEDSQRNDYSNDA